MCQNFLQLNKEKTQVIAFGNKDEVLKVNVYLTLGVKQLKIKVKNLEVILETDLSFSSHVKAVTIISKALQELEVLFPVKIWKNVFMSLSPAGWIIIMSPSKEEH